MLALVAVIPFITLSRRIKSIIWFRRGEGLVSHVYPEFTSEILIYTILMHIQQRLLLLHGEQ